MPDQQRVLDHARKPVPLPASFAPSQTLPVTALAAELKPDMNWVAGEYGGGYWEARGNSEGVIHGRAVAALEFLREYAGAEGNWCVRAVHIWESKGDNKSLGTAAYHLGELLVAWADQVDAGKSEMRSRGCVRALRLVL